MKKQYRISEVHLMKATVEIYHNGKLISSERIWLDDADKKAMQLEKDGYIYGYTQEEVDEAKGQYEAKLDNLIKGDRNA